MNKFKHIFTTILVTGVLITGTHPVYAEPPSSEQTAQMRELEASKKKDARVSILESFLEKNNSPMKDSASHFINEADRLKLDWRLVVAIAGLESTFGQHIPPGSFNAYGWGIPSGASSGIVFTDWNDGITKVSEGLRKNYIDKGAVTLEQIGHIYAASPTWAQRVGGIMNRIEKYSHDIDHLELTL